MSKLTYETLANQVIDDLRSDGRNFIQVCGPVSTGGLGNPEANLERISRVVEELRSSGHAVFDQVPYEDAIVALASEVEGYDMRILNEFYLPIFESGCITDLVMLPDWKTSKGATWERETGELLGLKVHYWNPDTQLDL